MEDTQSGYYLNRNNRFITGLSEGVRRKIYDIFVSRFGECASILDVGVTCERTSPEANFLEKWYPHKSRITAAGIEDASFLERDYPGMRFVRVEPGRPLPFQENRFEVVFSHAVVEHIVPPSERRVFLSELLRVGRHVFLTTPNRYFPIEPHTKVPLVHCFSPALFNWLMDQGALGQFYSRHNLDLLSRADLEALAGELGAAFEIQSVRCLGWTSNLILIASRVAN